MWFRNYLLDIAVVIRRFMCWCIVTRVDAEGKYIPLSSNCFHPPLCFAPSLLKYFPFFIFFRKGGEGLGKTKIIWSTGKDKTN